MPFLDSYRNYLNNRGGNIKNSFVNSFSRNVITSMKNSPSYYEVSINGSESLTPALIIDDSKNQDIKTIALAPEFTLSRGDYINWENEIWIITIVDKQGNIYYRGQMEECNSDLKWIDEKGIVRSFPCVFYFNNRSNSGVDEDKVMGLPDGRRQVVVQNNEHTRKIRLEKRFLFGGTAYKVIDFDLVSDAGLVNLILKQDVLKDNVDNIELGIADYYNNIANYTIEILNGDSISIQSGNSVQLNVVVKNNGVEEEAQVSYSSSDESIATVDENGLVTGVNDGSALITVSLVDDNTVSDTISVTVETVIVDNFSIEIVGVNEIKNGQSKTFEAVVYNNGIQTNESVVWQLFSNDKVSNTTLAIITNYSGSSCTIKNNNSNFGSVYLKATLQKDSNVSVWKQINMKPLF
jgi:hypothetical protein